MADPSARLERSVLLVPASNPAMIAKAVASDADAVCIDLEDAVAPREKEASRAHVIHALTHLDFGHSLRMFRMNALDTPYAYRDLIEVVEAAGDHLDLVMLPKADRPEDVCFVETLLAQIEMAKGFRNRIGIEAQIETALGCVNVNAIAACSARVETLIYGPGDYAASLRMPMDVIGVLGRERRAVSRPPLARDHAERRRGGAGVRQAVQRRAVRRVPGLGGVCEVVRDRPGDGLRRQVGDPPEPDRDAEPRLLAAGIASGLGTASARCLRRGDGARARARSRWTARWWTPPRSASPAPSSRRAPSPPRGMLDRRSGRIIWWDRFATCQAVDRLQTCPPPCASLLRM